MVMAIALPILAFVAILFMQLEERDRQAVERRTGRDAQLLAMTIDRQLYAMATTLQLLANAPELPAGDLAQFHARTRAALNSNSLYLLVVRADGRQLLNSRVDFGSPLGSTSNQIALDTALASGRIEASNVFLGATSGRWVFNVIMPLPEGMPDGARALILTQNADDLGRLIQTEGLPAGWSAAVIDHVGAIVHSSAGGRSGEPFDAGLVARMSGLGGIVTDSARTPNLAAGYARLHNWGWTAVVWGPLETAQASLASTWRSLVLGGFLLVGLALAAAFVVGRRLRNSIVQVSGMAQRLGRGEIVSPATTRIEEVDRVAMALSVASFDRSEAEDRIRFVLNELAHRTKNMLSVVQAMIRQTARQSGNAETFQEMIGQRLISLGRSIDLLTAEEWSGVSLRQVVTSHLSTFMEPGPRLEIAGRDIALRPQAVQNLGMAFFELATNAVKYGAWSSPSGTVRIEWSDVDAGTEDARLTIRWVETGGPVVSSPSRKGFGTIVIESQLESVFRGSVDLNYGEDGFSWTLDAPLAQLQWDRKQGGDAE